MKKGVILYTPGDAAKNRWFIDRFISAAEERNCVLELVTSAEDLPGSADFAVNRSRSCRVAEKLEERGIPVFNSAFVTGTANDKWNTYMLLKGKVPVADTYPAGEKCPIDIPCIVKPRCGHGGENVFLVRNAQEYTRALECINSMEHEDLMGGIFYDEPIVQPLLDKGKDLRVYVLGGRIIAAVMRTGTRDHRSNFSLGGRAELVTPGDDIAGIALKANSLIGADFAGIDFIFDRGRPVVNEIEDAAGSRMLYSLMPDIDIPGLFIEHILRKIG